MPPFILDYNLSEWEREKEGGREKKVDALVARWFATVHKWLQLMRHSSRHTLCPANSSILSALSLPLWYSRSFLSKPSKVKGTTQSQVKWLTHQFSSASESSTVNCFPPNTESLSNDPLKQCQSVPFRLWSINLLCIFMKWLLSSPSAHRQSAPDHQVNFSSGNWSAQRDEKWYSRRKRSSLVRTVKHENACVQPSQFTSVNSVIHKLIGLLFAQYKHTSRGRRRNWEKTKESEREREP